MASGKREFFLRAADDRKYIHAPTPGRKEILWEGVRQPDGSVKTYVGGRSKYRAPTYEDVKSNPASADSRLFRLGSDSMEYAATLSGLGTVGRVKSASKVARTAGGWSETAEYASGAFKDGSIRMREFKNLVSPPGKELGGGLIGGFVEVGKRAANVNNWVGRHITYPLFGSLGAPSWDARIAAAASGSAAKAGFLRGAADTVASPIGLPMLYLWLTNGSRQKEQDDKAVADNKAAMSNAVARVQFNSDVVEAVERRSDKVVLNHWLTKKLAEYDKANGQRVQTAYSRGQKDRPKGDHSEAGAVERTANALASVDAENLAALMDGIDRESDAWKALRADREKFLVQSAEDRFVERYGYDYSTADEMRRGRDAAKSAKAVKDMTEFLGEVRSSVPTNGVDEIRFMTGGAYGK